MSPSDPFRTPVADVSARRPRPGHGGAALLTQPRRVRAARGANWMTDGFALFGSGVAGWLLAALLISIPYAIAMTLNFYFLRESVVLQAAVSLLTTPLIIVIWGGVMYACDYPPFRFGRVVEGMAVRWSRLIALGLALTLIGFAIGIIINLVSDPGVLQGTGGVSSAEVMDNLVRILLVTLVLGTPVFMAIWFAPALVAVGQVPTLQALQLSFKACLINVLPFFVFSLLAVALLVVGSVLLAIVSGVILGLTGMLGRLGAPAGGLQPVMLLVLVLNFSLTFIFLAVTWAAQYVAFAEVFLSAGAPAQDA